jgi:hypothetical protein
MQHEFSFATNYAKNHQTKPCNNKRKYSKLGLLGPRDKMKNQDENNTQGKKKGNYQLVFSTKLVFKGVPFLVFWIGFNCTFTTPSLLLIFHKFKPFRNDILQIF